MKANSIGLQKTFEQAIRYRIPLFQRPYVWTEDNNWTPIWDDVRTLAEKKLRTGDSPPHFLGAVVLDQLRGDTGTIETRQVIDGQQRLTTLQLLLAAIRDLAREHDVSRYADRFGVLTSNSESFQDHQDDEFKVWPTNRDRDDYRKAMQAGSPGSLKDAHEVGRNKRRIGSRIADAYLYFHGALAEWLTRNGEAEDGEEPLGGTLEDRFEALWYVLRNRLLLVVIDLEDDDDAQVIFETLNARGTQLLPADLVKNYLFHMAELEGAPIQDLYDKHWRHFDEDFWRQEVRQGRLKRPRIDLFLQHYLTLKTYDEVNVGHIFGVFKQYTSITPKTAESGDGEPVAVQEKAEDHLGQLTRYGGVFRRFHEPEEGSRAALFFRRLYAIDTATVFPFLLEAFLTFGQPEQGDAIEHILVDLESFLARRMMCGMTMKNYNRLFLDLVRNAEKTGGVTPEGVRAFLLKLEGDSVRWPNDEELSDTFVVEPFYRALSQVKQRMVLQAIDSEMETSKSEAIAYPSKLTIEHLMPQSWRDENWPLTETDDEAKRQNQIELRASLLHTIGNLTLLTGSLNSSVSNGPWADKRPEVLKHSKLNLNRYFQYKETWDEQEIVRRSKVLFELARKVWPHPGTE